MIPFIRNFGKDDTTILYQILIQWLPMVETEGRIDSKGAACENFGGWGSCSESFFFFFNCFWCGPFPKSLLNLSQHCFCSMSWSLGHEACGIPAPRPGIEPAPPTLEGEVPTTGLPGKSLFCILIVMVNTFAKNPYNSNSKEGLLLYVNF